MFFLGFFILLRLGVSFFGGGFRDFFFCSFLFSDVIVFGLILSVYF